MATDNTQLNLPDILGGDIIATDALSTVNGAPAIADLKVQRVKVGFGADGDLNDVNSGNPLPVADATLAGKDFATQTTLAAVLAKLTSDPATQTTLAAILAKIISAPATEAKQDTGNTSLASIDSKLTNPLPISGTVSAVIAGAVEVTNDAGNPLPVNGTITANAGTNLNTSLLAVEAGGNLAAILAKLIAAPSTEAKQDAGNTSLSTIAAKDFSTETTLAAFYAALGLTQGMDATTAKGPMVQGLVNDVPASYLVGQLQPVSLTSDGRVRVSAVSSDVTKVWNNTFDNPFFNEDVYGSGNNYFTT